MLTDKKIVLGVTGGIAAYKGLELVSRLRKLGAQIDVIMTKSAAEFVTPLSFESLSHNPVISDMFESPKSWDIQHISLAKKADLLIVAPATANIIGKVANGIADDMLSTTIMATKASVLFAPAMNCNMYENPIVQENIGKLKSLGYMFIEPSTGMLACGDIGKGKLADIADIVDEIEQVLYDKKDFSGLKILVTAGPTIEPIDPIRYITNHSSGKMGYAIAECARNRGGNVTLISGPTNLKPPRNVDVIHVNTNHEMYRAVMDNYNQCDVIIKAAAVADYKPSVVSKQKIKKTEDNLTLNLEKNIDILSEVGRQKGNRILVGFAAESENLIENAQMKIERKNLDMIVANDITSSDSGFKSDNNTAVIITKDGRHLSLPKMTKFQMADNILDNIKSLMR
jgi:phosphopantothenoylcysteine decarboxylase/phosphopantothenate--cysteine ligase, prokaryotic